MSEQTAARLVAHPEPGKVWVQIPHRNDIGSDWIAVDELPPAQPPAAPETDVSALREWAARFLVQCGPCDGGLPMQCSCTTEDERPLIAALLDALDAARERVRVVEGERDRLREVLRVGAELDNHHNADACPYCTGGTTARAESAEAAHEALRKRIETLVGMWVRDEDEGVEHVVGCQNYRCRECVVIACATDLRALLPGGAS